jgi:hypothetical protein
MSLAIEQDLEEILVGWLKTKAIEFVQDAGATRQRIFKGLENEESATDENEESSIIRIPCITVYCDSAEPIGPEFCGNYELDARFEVTSNSYDSTAAVHKARVEQVWELIMSETLLAELQAFHPDFYTSKIVYGKRGYNFDGDCWTNYMVLTFRHFIGRQLE